MATGTGSRQGRLTATWPVPAWAGWTAVTFVATTYHLLIDLHLGLFGEISTDMSVVKGLWGLATAGLLCWWMLVTVLGAAGHGPALRAALVITVVEGLLANGLVAVAAAPPPSDAFPWQDIAHFGALGAGAVATRLAWRELRDRGAPRGGWLVLVTVALIVATMALSAPLNLDAIATPR